MKNKRLAVFAVAAGLLVLSGPLFAHHAASTYDQEHPVTLTGSVTDFQFINPHVLIVFEVKAEDGAVVQWAAGSAPPQSLERAGWNRQSLKPGDQITVTGAPHKEGKKELSVIKLVGPTGQVLTQPVN